MSNKDLIIKEIWRFLVLIRNIKPDIIQAWMYHSFLFGVLAKLQTKRNTSIIWNVRHSLHDIRYEKPLTAFIIKIGALLSFVPEKIIYNSDVSALQHESIGFSSKKTSLEY